MGILKCLIEIVVVYDTTSPTAAYNLESSDLWDETLVVVGRSKF